MNSTNQPDRRSDGPPPRDEMDDLLRTWHAANADRARAGRDRLLTALQRERSGASVAPAAGRPHARAIGASPRAFLGALATFVRVPAVRAAASLVLVIALVALLVPLQSTPAWADPILIAEGGRLEARDEQGNLIGPCPLKHTDVDVAVSGDVARVTVRQRFHNPYETKIEATYTFPLSHRGAVDRMSMVVGDRVITGEVKERGEARRVYEAARAQGYIASLLEQERPNIFTQSVANIEPGAEVDVEISYVEMVPIRDGLRRFDFPMVVAPRYIPGTPSASRARVPAELNDRHGVILRGPAQFTLGHSNDVETLGALHAGSLRSLLGAARPIAYPGAVWWGEGADAKLPAVWYSFEAAYTDGSREIGWLYTDGTGQINGRWFYADPDVIREMGTGFAPDTNRVPDASRITPMPVRPEERAGHDVSVTVRIDTGGPRITGYRAELHEIVKIPMPVGGAGEGQLTLVLAERDTIPNRDFLLEWSVADEAIEEAHFAHRAPPAAPITGMPEAGGDDSEDADDADDDAGFFTLVLQPPARVADGDVRPRELVFVMDSSGSMEGFPIEKAKAIMVRAIETMRARDTFNVITFNDSTSVLWPSPRPATEDNRVAAIAYVESRQGGGGTEMREAVLAALAPPAQPGDGAISPADLANLPADGRRVQVRTPLTRIGQEDDRLHRLHVREDLALDLDLHADLPTVLRAEGVTVVLAGTWTTHNGRRILAVDRVEVTARKDVTPLRTVFFLSDGEVGNDGEIIDHVRRLAAEKRVFTVGIGSSPNRSLLDEMAKAGRGASDYVSLEGDADGAVKRFVRRVGTPVLTDIAFDFDEHLEVHDTIPPLDEITDLYDESPLIIHGRYRTPGAGTLTIRGTTGAGAWERRIDLDLPEAAPEHDVIATLWARAQVDELERAGDRAGIVALGVRHQIMTQYTSFVAVERSRITIGGKPMLVAVPIEMPLGQSWHGTFGEAGGTLRGLFALYAYDQAMAQSVDLIARGDYDGAQQAALTAQIRLRQERASFSEDEYGAWIDASGARLAAIERAREIARLQGEAGSVGIEEVQRSVAAADEKEAQRIEAEVEERLVRVRELQVARRYEEAIDVTDEILILDENNPAGKMFKDVIAAEALYAKTGRVERMKQLVDGEDASEARTISDLMAYPEGWPQGTGPDDVKLGFETNVALGENATRWHFAGGRSLEIQTIDGIAAYGRAAAKFATAPDGSITYLGGPDGAPIPGQRGSAPIEVTEVTELSLARIPVTDKYFSFHVAASGEQLGVPALRDTQPNVTAFYDTTAAATSPVPSPPGGGGFGGGGGAGRGGDGGGSGSVFGEPADDRLSAIPGGWDDLNEKLTVEEQQHVILDALTEMVAPEDWQVNGGAFLAARFDAAGLVIETLDDSAEARAGMDRALAFLSEFGTHLAPDASIILGVPIQPANAAPAEIGFRDSAENLEVLRRLETTEITGSGAATTMKAALEGIARTAGVRLDADWTALEIHSDVLPGDAVTLDATGQTAAEALGAVRSQVGDEFEYPWIFARDGGLVVTTYDAAAREKSIVAYGVTDLLGRGTDRDDLEDQGPRAFFEYESIENLIDLIMETVEPEGWFDNGGETGSMRYGDGVLLIMQPVWNHRAIQALLTDLRMMLGLDPGPGRVDPPMSRDARRLASDLDHTWAWPDRQLYDVRDLLSLCLEGIEPFERWSYAEYLESFQSLIDVIMENIDPDGWFDNGGDTGALGAIRGLLIIGNTPANQGRIAWFLNRIRLALGLAPRGLPGEEPVAAGGVPQRRRAMEMYDVRSLVRDAAQAAGSTPSPRQRDPATRAVLDALVDAIVHTIEPDSWFDNGGDLGSITTFGPVLIVNTSPENQAHVEQLLSAFDVAPVAAELIREAAPRQVPPPRPAPGATLGDPQTTTPEDAVIEPPSLVAEEIATEPAAAAESPTFEDQAAALAAAAAARTRLARLAHVIDARLHPLVRVEEVDGEQEKAERLLVSVLATDVKSATLDALRDAGLEIEDHATSIPVVVGRTAPEDLDDLALLDVVRRIEPVNAVAR